MEERLINVAQTDFQIRQEIEGVRFGPTRASHFKDKRIFTKTPVESGDILSVLSGVPKRPWELK